MTTIDRADLRAKAEAATPGPWEAYGTAIDAIVDNGCNGCSGLPSPAHLPECHLEEIAGAGESDAEYIAAFDPPTALALLDALDAAEAEVRKAKAEALRAAADHIDGEEPHHLGDSDLDPLNYNTLGEYGIDRAAEWLRTHATEYETGAEHD